MTLDEIEEQIKSKSIELDNLLALKEQIKEHDNEWLNKYNNTFYIDSFGNSVYKIDKVTSFDKERNELYFIGKKVLYLDSIHLPGRCEFFTGNIHINLNCCQKTDETVYYNTLNKIKEYIGKY